jgi:hypothetical protein
VARFPNLAPPGPPDLDRYPNLAPPGPPDFDPARAGPVNLAPGVRPARPAHDASLRARLRERLKTDPRARRLISPAHLDRLLREVDTRRSLAGEAVAMKPAASSGSRGVGPAPDGSTTAVGKLPDPVVPWDGCDPLPTGDTGCGWRFRGHLARLVDPNAVTCAEVAAGTTVGGTADLGWWLSAGSTCTIQMPCGTLRMYMQNPRLATLCGEADVVWPYRDASGTEKFGVTTDDGFTVQRLGDGTNPTVEEWWRADPELVSDPSELHFAQRYIAFLDSDTAGDFAVLAPELVPSMEATACWAAAQRVAFATSQGRAGWQSTDIPYTDDSTVYRDPSVCLLTASGWSVYLMVLVECTSETLAESSDTACSICTPATDGCSAYADTPTTRLVYFASTCPDFRESSAPVYGPFPLLATEDQPDPDKGEWFGVPQALTDPSGEHLLVIVNRTQGTTSIYAANVDDVLTQLLDHVDGGSGSAFGRHVDGIGNQGWPVTGSTPESGQAPTVTDPHLVFDADGVAHFFYANRYTGDPGGWLDLLSSAHAAYAYVPDLVGAWLDETNDIFKAIEALFTALTVFALDPGTCDPLCLSAVLRPLSGCQAYRGGYGAGDLINDPDVFLSLSGEYQATFHSGVLGGLVYATAPASDASRTRSVVRGGFAREGARGALPLRGRRPEGGRPAGRFGGRPASPGPVPNHALRAEPGGRRRRLRRRAAPHCRTSMRLNLSWISRLAVELDSWICGVMNTRNCDFAFLYSLERYRLNSPSSMVASSGTLL